uniref:Uncharacterized protein n=1 Tax=Arundo donax TaxID=35708 RepID=A0A0A9FAF2_ARUDO
MRGATACQARATKTVPTGIFKLMQTLRISSLPGLGSIHLLYQQYKL